MSKTMLAALVVGVMAAAYLPSDAEAATVRVKCEKRSNRSKISIDGAGLIPGGYKCQALSGSNQKTTTLRNTIGVQLECDLDSDRGDIAAGATAISKTFIQGGQVTGKILDASGATVISDTVRCRMK
jgi:hypothetical protein